MKSLIELIFLRTWNSWSGLFASLLLTPLLIFLPATSAAYVQSEQVEETESTVQIEVEAVEELEQLPTEPNPLLLEDLRPAEVYGVDLVEIDDGIKIVLITDSPEAVEVFQSQEGTTLTVDIVDAVLSLEEGNRYEELNPVAGVASLTLEQRGREIRMTVISDSEAPPVAYFERLSEALQLDVVTLIPGQTDEDIDFSSNNLRIIVTAEPLDGFRVQNATTATRTDTALIDVPQGIQVITEEVIRSQGSTTLGDTLRNVSGATSGRASTGLQATTPIIRGFESNNVLRNGLRDDTLRIGAGINNVSQIEILKGPASVLFGAGSLGGTINLVTDIPLNEPLYEYEIAGGTNDFYRAAIDWTGPFNEEGQLGYRLNMAYENRGSFRDFESSELFFVAPSLQLANTERSSLILDIEYLARRSYGTATGLSSVAAIGAEDNSFVTRVLNSGSTFNRASLDRAGTLDIATNPSEPEISYTETNIARLGYRFEYDFNDNWAFRNEFLASFQDTPQDTVVGATGYSQPAGQLNFETVDRIFLDNTSNRRIYTLNTNVVGNYDLGGIEQTLLLGTEFSSEYSRDVLLQRLFATLDPSRVFNLFDPVYSPDDFAFVDNGSFNNNRFAGDSTTRRQTLGFYGQLQLDLTDYLIVLLGGRYDIADQLFEDVAARGTTEPFSSSDTAFTPRAGIVLKPAENISLYAGYSESFVPVIGQNFDGDIFVPERGRQLEYGIKTNLLDNRLSMTLAYYDLRRSNVVIQDPREENIGFQLQVGEQASSGIEFDLVGELLPGWNIIANYAYTDARVSKDDVLGEGTRLQNAARNSANLWTSYQIQSGDLEGLGLGIGISYVGNRNGDIREPFTIPAYTRTDASLFYRKDGFNAQINFQNLFNTRYFQGARDQFRVIPGSPFAVEARLGWEF
ncbi:MAG: TonB-dependent siderophore receptor [Cyanobacteria bacterium P01_D01_bin.36]